METDIVNMLLSGGPFGAVAAFFFYRWQKAESDLKELRASVDIRVESSFKAIIDMQEKRILDTGRIEGVLQSNTSALASQTQLLQAIMNQRGTP